MSQPIYKIFMAKYTDAWYQLKPEEQQAQNNRINDALKSVGGESVLFCLIPGGSPYLGMGVEKFPDMESLQKHTMMLLQLNHFRYSESVECIGTEIPRE